MPMSPNPPSDEKLVDAEKPETVTNVLKHMTPQLGGLPRLQGILNEARKYFMAVMDGGRFHVAIDFSHQFLMIGSFAMGMMGDRYNAEQFVKLLCDKSRMYGDKPIRAWGIMGVMIRIDSKVLRLDNIRTNGLTDMDDTVMDILGYAVLGYRLIETTKGK